MKTRNLYSKLSKYQSQADILQPRVTYVNSMPDDGKSFLNRLFQIKLAISLCKDLIASGEIVWPLRDSQIPF